MILVNNEGNILFEGDDDPREAFALALRSEKDNIEAKNGKVKPWCECDLYGKVPIYLTSLDGARFSNRKAIYDALRSSPKYKVWTLYVARLRDITFDEHCKKRRRLNPNV